VPLEVVEVTTLHPERFAEVLPPDGLAAFQASIARGNELLGSRTIWNVNPTAFGGGVAEMLRTRTRPSAWARPRARACATNSSVPATSASTSTCSSASSSTRGHQGP
jgi:hypothetical protein